MWMMARLTTPFSQNHSARSPARQTRYLDLQRTTPVKLQSSRGQVHRSRLRGRVPVHRRHAVLALLALVPTSSSRETLRTASANYDLQQRGGTPLALREIAQCRVCRTSRGDLRRAEAARRSGADLMPVCRYCLLISDRDGSALIATAASLVSGRSAFSPAGSCDPSALATMVAVAGVAIPAMSALAASAFALRLLGTSRCSLRRRASRR